MESTTKSRYLSMQDLIEQEKTHPIWVLNTTHLMGDDMPASNVFITITRRDGNSTPLEIPQTWLPIRITDKAPRQDILNSTHFMSALERGTIHVITDEEAQRLKAKPAASAEAARLAQESRAVQTATKEQRRERPENRVSMVGVEGSANSSAKPEVVGVGQSVKATSAMAAEGVTFNLGGEAEAPEADPMAISEEFRDWVGELGMLPEDEALTLMSKYGKFQPAEIMHLTKKATHNKIKQWAMDQGRKLGLL